MECGAFDKPSLKLPPDILIVLDVSGSMDQDAMNAMCSGGCGATSKWALMTPAINTVVQQTETEVNWGLKFFADMGTTCGVAANTVAVNVAPMNAAMVAAAITGRTSANGGVAGNGSRTPTRAGENAAVTYLSGLADTNPKFIVLAMDGSPNCPATVKHRQRRHGRGGGRHQDHPRATEMFPPGRYAVRLMKDDGYGELAPSTSPVR